MLQRIKKFIEQNNMNINGAKIVVALSGGADSVCLLMVLKELQKEFDYKLQAIHINHGIRGSEADADEKFCVDFCTDNEIPIKVKHYNIPELAESWHMSLEEAGRKARYEAFEQELGNGDGFIAVAHHKNDNVETVLFNMARGSMLGGMAGIRPVNGRIIRPLLCVSRRDIEEYLAEKGQSYCIDSTNLSNDYSRNALRNQVIPVLEGINEAGVDNISALSDYVLKVENFLEKIADEAYEAAVSGSENRLIVAIDKLVKYDEIIADKILYRVICECAGRKKDIERIHVEQLKNLLNNNSGKKIDLPYGIKAYNQYGTVIVTKDDILAKNCEDDSWELKVFVQKEDYETFVRGFEKNYPEKKFCTIEVDYDKIKCGLVLRPRQTGDYMVINKTGTRKTINRIFIDDKIPVSSRNMPIVFDGNEAVWICGKRKSPRYKLDENSVSKAIVVIVGSNLE